MRVICTLVMVVLLVAFLTLSATSVPALDIKESTKLQTQSKLTFDSARTAVLIMDYQNDIVGMLPENKQVPLLEKANSILKQSRQAGLRVIYVVVRFRDGYPEINLRNKLFAGLKESGRLREGTPGAEIHPRVAAQPGDVVVTKRRVGAFSTTDLEKILRANSIDTLVMFGIASSGVVLSTVRWAADMDYNLFVVSDACADIDEDVHRLLTEKVFPRQATMLTTEEFLNAIGRKAGIEGDK